MIFTNYIKVLSQIANFRKNQWVLGNIGLDIQKILSKMKPWPLESLKSELRRKRYASFKINNENYFLKNYLLSHDFQGPIWGVKLDLAVPTYQKYISMLSHDSGDIKNVENELITKKIQAFELRRIYIYISISFSIIIFAAKLSLRDTTFSAVFLYDRISLSPSRS